MQIKLVYCPPEAYDESYSQTGYKKRQFPDSNDDGILRAKRRAVGRIGRGLRATDIPQGKDGSSPTLGVPIEEAPAKPFDEYSGSPPGPEWFDADGNFKLLSRDTNSCDTQEDKERRRHSRIDFYARDVEYILALCEAARGNLWKCKVDDTISFMVGCRNYIVPLLFEDGKRWLLKTSQPNKSWDLRFRYNKILLDREIATTLWVFASTSIPVPQIRLWDLRTTTANKFGKPWYVMQMSKGTTIFDMHSEAAKELGFNWQKKRLEQCPQLAKFQLEFLKHSWDGLNMLCDADFCITAIIDWELAKLVPFQLAMEQPSMGRPDISKQIQYYFEIVAGLPDVHDRATKVREILKEQNRKAEKLRNEWIKQVRKLDDSTSGDGGTPWTSGYKYVTGLCQIARAINLIWDFLHQYEKILDLSEETRLMIIEEVERIVRAAVGLAKKRAPRGKSARAKKA
ncbi:hypothetical protein ABW19_dt0201399 [Dactylella cylindrospora]|nr:hypothetical protein ABW19_dt0201399 [Dactylella cylindrospora]